MLNILMTSIFMASNIEILKEFGIPLSTLADWRTARKDSWRFKLYNFLKYKYSSIEHKKTVCSNQYILDSYRDKKEDTNDG